MRLVTNTVAVIGQPWGQSSQNFRCRHCDEKETLAHVLGKCGFTLGLRNQRHHEIRSHIANGFKTKGFDVFEEVTSDRGTRIDMIVIDKKRKTGLILDPTIRFESAENQAVVVDEEKRDYYKNTIPYFKEVYELRHIDIVGLYLGSRGTIPKFFTDFCYKHKFDKKFLFEIGLKVMRSSLRLLRFHLSNP
jgi:hypothetical protein